MKTLWFVYETKKQQIMIYRRTYETVKREAKVLSEYKKNSKENARFI